MADKEFVDGLMIKPPHKNAPHFVKAAISIKRADLGNWLRAKQDEWINLSVKESKNGKWYAEVDTWKPQQQPDEQGKPFNDKIPNNELEDLPF
jgi:hypothetical protein